MYGCACVTMSTCCASGVCLNYGRCSWHIPRTAGVGPFYSSWSMDDNLLNEINFSWFLDTRTWKHKTASKERARVATTTNHNSTINEWAMMDPERGRGQCARLKDQATLSQEGNALHACVCLVCVALLALSPCNGMMIRARPTFSHASPFLPS